MDMRIYSIFGVCFFISKRKADDILIYLDGFTFRLYYFAGFIFINK